MAGETIIAWAHATFNAWMGCVKVSPGCKHCYAETLTKNRMGLKLWGPASTTPRQVTSEAYWHQPIRWNAEAERARKPARVFCGSLMDWAEDHPTAKATRPRLWDLIRRTPWLDWLLLTKRADRIAKCLPGDWGDGYRNVWLGVSAERQLELEERLPDLLQIPASVRFVSLEPLLGPIDLGAVEMPDGDTLGTGLHSNIVAPERGEDWNGIDWVIVGGESGPGFRPMDHAWARDLREQCRSAGVPFFFKQSAAFRTEQGITLDGEIIREYPEGWKRPFPWQLRLRVNGAGATDVLR